MKRLILPLLAALTLPIAINAESSWNDKPICILTNEYSSDYKIKNLSGRSSLDWDFIL